MQPRENRFPQKEAPPVNRGLGVLQRNGQIHWALPDNPTAQQIKSAADALIMKDEDVSFGSGPPDNMSSPSNSNQQNTTNTSSNNPSMPNVWDNTPSMFQPKMPKVSEGEVVDFRAPNNRSNMQNLDNAKSLTRAIYQVGYYHDSSEAPDMATLSEYRDELHKLGYNVSIKFDPRKQEDYAILQNKMTNERYTMSEDDLIGESLYEAEYHGRKVPLGKPMRGDTKKFKVFVRDPKSGNIKKVNFGHGGTSAKRRGEKTMRIKKSIPSRRKSFRARHHCENPGPRTKARYWACRTW